MASEHFGKISYLKSFYSKQTNLNIKKLKYNVKLNNEKKEYSYYNDYVYIGLENIDSWTGKIVETNEFIPKGISTKYEIGDILFGKLRPYLAKVYIADKGGYCTTEAIVMRCQNELYPKFLFYFLISSIFIKEINSFTYGAKMPRINWEILGNLPIIYSTVKKQKEIADFLDVQTTHIDKLISQKEKLIGLIEEKRISVITNAITKGLNPRQKMKVTNLFWLEEIPAHWKLSKIGFCFKIKLGKMLQSEPHDEHDILKPYLRAANIQWDKINRENIYEMYFNEREMCELKLKKGDLLISEGGDIGRSCIWNSDEEMYYQNAILRAREPKKLKVKIKFLYYWLYFLKMKGILDLYCNTATISHYTAEKVNSTKLIYPDIKEQAKIINYIDDNVKFIDSVVSKTENSIEKLKEYRSALITAAVTGQIDVRDFKNKNNDDDGI